MKVQTIMADLERKHPGESEYLQAVQEVLESIEEVYNLHPEFEKAKIIERMVEPDRTFISALFGQTTMARLIPIPVIVASLMALLAPTRAACVSSPMLT